MVSVSIALIGQWRYKKASVSLGRLFVSGLKKVRVLEDGFVPNVRVLEDGFVLLLLCDACRSLYSTGNSTHLWFQLFSSVFEKLYLILCSPASIDSSLHYPLWPLKL